MERETEGGSAGILGEFIDPDELGPAPGVRAAVRRALEAAGRAAERAGLETNRDTDPGEARLVGGSSVSGDNLVDIEPQNLAAEAASVEIPAEPAGAPAPATPGAEAAPVAAAAAELTMEQLQASVPAWKPGTDLIANTLADVIAPNWRITREERDQVSGAFALALAAWFPDDVIPIKYLVLMNVGASLWNLAASRRDPTTGKFIPMRIAPPADAAKTAGEGAAPAAASGPVTTSTGSAATTST